MSLSATAMSVRRACRMIKALMNHHPEEWSDWRQEGRQAAKRILEGRMQWREHCLEDQLSRGLQDRRNGSYRRRLLIPLGEIELSIPRTRPFNPVSVVQAYARRAEDVDRAILSCFVFGLSTRKAAEALLPNLGHRVSAATVSRVARSLDADVAAFHGRPLTNRYKALQFDGVVLSRKTGPGALRWPVLVALGITVEVITVDGGQGLLAALEVVYAGLPLDQDEADLDRETGEWGAGLTDLERVAVPPRLPDRGVRARCRRILPLFCPLDGVHRIVRPSRPADRVPEAVATEDHRTRTRTCM